MQKILITAGPTREYIDPVRFISNESSGKMGIALANEAIKLGFSVTLILGPVTACHSRSSADISEVESFPLPLWERVGERGKCKRIQYTPPSNSLPHWGGRISETAPSEWKSGLYGIKIINIVSAKDMFEAVKKHYAKADVIIMSAAVADYTPAKFSKQKLKKSPNSKILKLKPTVDILKWLGQHKKAGQKLIGFALETQNLLKNAQIKLKNKKCDAIIANLATNIGKNAGSATILLKNGEQVRLSSQTKQSLAQKILDVCNHCEI